MKVELGRRSVMKMRLAAAIAIPSALCLLGVFLLWRGGPSHSQEVGTPTVDDARLRDPGPAKPPSRDGQESGPPDSGQQALASPAGMLDPRATGSTGSPSGAPPGDAGELHHEPVRAAGVDLDGDAALWRKGLRTGLLEAWRQVAKDHPTEPSGMHARDLILATTLEDGEPATLADDAAEWIQYLCEASKARPGKRRYAGCFWTEAGDKDPMGRLFEALAATGRTARPPIESVGTGGVCVWAADTLQARLDGAEPDPSHRTLRAAVVEFLGIASSYLRPESGWRAPAAQTKERAGLVDAFLAKYASAPEKPVAAMVQWLKAWYPK